MKKKINSFTIIIISFILPLIYAIVRYNIIKGVPWFDFPLYVMNKVFAISSLILFSLYQLSIQKDKLNAIKLYREYAIVLGISHLIISVIIMSPHYFPKYYNDLKFNLTGELSILFGVCAFSIIVLMLTKNLLEGIVNKVKYRDGIAKLFFIFIISHIFITGYSGWLDPGTWPGGLPPITMISFIIAVIPFTMKIISKNS